MSKGSAEVYPKAVNPEKVGTYPAHVYSGGGYFYDQVLEYRVWFKENGESRFMAFATFSEADDFYRNTESAEEPIALVLQEESIDEPAPGEFKHIKVPRITEWQVDWLADGKREATSIDRFFEEK